MTDNLKIRQPADPNKINVNQEWELSYWASKFGVSEAKIKEAVKAAGVMVADVRRHLNK